VAGVFPVLWIAFALGQQRRRSDDDGVAPAAEEAVVHGVAEPEPPVDAESPTSSPLSGGVVVQYSLFIPDRKNLYGHDRKIPV
jgi:hypothetical protein